ncbi:MAG TPA: NINE protein [Candidatus Limosilactobacillus faecipullorum]|nr:NINE protein [Candidatus Limosilactobacillus faecipullorum]
MIDRTQLTDKELLIFGQEIELQKKNTIIAYVLWWFFGFMGGHRYYLGKIGSAIAMTLIFWLGIWVFGIGAAITLIWALVDVFMISSWLKEDQEQVENKVYNDLLTRRKITDKNLQSKPISNVSAPQSTRGNTTSSTSTSLINSYASTTSAVSQGDNAESVINQSTINPTTDNIKPCFCSKCGAKLVDDASFCANCGSAVN